VAEISALAALPDAAHDGATSIPNTSSVSWPDSWSDSARPGDGSLLSERLLTGNVRW